MVLIYESMSKGYAHLPVNECMLRIIDNVFKEDKVFYAESKHNDLLKANIKGCNLKFVNVKIPDLKNKIKAIYVEIFNQLWIKWKNRKNNITNIILTNSPSHTVFLIKLLYKKCKVTFIIHGSLEECIQKKKLYNLGYYYISSLMFRNGDDKINYIVLGESIKENALKIMPQIGSNLYSIHHPYDFNNVLNNKISEYVIINRKIKIGTIGIGAKAKGTNLIFDIEKKLGELVGKKLELFHVGKMVNIEIPQNSKVNIFTQSDFISTEKYNELIMQLDYILFLFPTDSYKLTASGTILDAIKFKKPIIALKNDYFKCIFDEIGEIGYLCNDIEEIVECISKLVTFNTYPHPQNFFSNVENARIKFDYKNVEKEIKELGLWR